MQYKLMNMYEHVNCAYIFPYFIDISFIIDIYSLLYRRYDVLHSTLYGCKCKI